MAGHYDKSDLCKLSGEKKTHRQRSGARRQNPRRLGPPGRSYTVTNPFPYPAPVNLGVNSGWLSDFHSAFENLLASLVDSGYTHDKFTIVHGGVFSPSIEFISRKSHSNKV